MLFVLPRNNIKFDKMRVFMQAQSNEHFAVCLHFPHSHFDCLKCTRKIHGRYKLISLLYHDCIKICCQTEEVRLF